MYHLTESLHRVKERAETHTREPEKKSPGQTHAKMKPKKWIQEVVLDPKFRHGAFTKKAQAMGHTVKEHMRMVLAHPDRFDRTTVRQAQFLANIQH